MYVCVCVVCVCLSLGRVGVVVVIKNFLRFREGGAEGGSWEYIGIVKHRVNIQRRGRGILAQRAITIAILCVCVCLCVCRGGVAAVGAWCSAGLAPAEGEVGEAAA